MTVDEKTRLLEKQKDDKKKDGEIKHQYDYKPVSAFQLYRFTTIFDKIMIALGVIFSIINGCLQPISSIITGSIVNVLLADVQKEQDRGLMERASPEIFGYLTIGIAILVVAYLQSAMWHTSVERQVHRIRKAFLRAVLRQDIAWFDKNQSGALTTFLTDNIERMKEGMGDKIGVCLQSASQFLVGFGIAFYYSWKMTLVMLTVMPFVMLFVFIFARIMSQQSKKEIASYAEAGGIAEEVLMNIKTVIAFNAQKREIKRYHKLLKEGRRRGTRKSILTGATLGVFFALLFSSFGLAFWYGSTLLSAGEIQPGTIFTVFNAVMSGAMAVGMVAPQITLFVTAKSAAAPIYDVLDRVPDIDSYSNEGKRPKAVRGDILFRNVTFGYPNRSATVLDDVTIEVSAGETVALVGHSGCGKSTLFSLLLRYYDTSLGSVSVDGEDVRKLNLQWLRSSVGSVSQEPILFHATIAENLRFGRENITLEEMISVCKMANAHDFITELPKGYETLVGDGGMQLSGGQKQRIAIARALARNPKILLLDEATSALDVESEALVQQALDKAAEGRTILVIAHRLATIKNANKIIVMQNGKVVEVGTHRELIEVEDGVYRHLVDAQTFENENELPPKKISRKKSSNVRVSVTVMDRGSQRERFHSEADTADHLTDDESEFYPSSKISRSEILSRQVSRKLSRSTPRTDEQADRLKEELREEGASKADWREILAVARKESKLLLCAVTFSILRGLMMPVFSIVFGQMFNTFAIADANVMRQSTLRNSVFFVALGLIQGIAAFTCLSLYGASGERLTMRLRMSVFKSLVRQDVCYFDDPRHSPTKLTTRLATDAPNVKSAIDQRMAVIVQGCISLVSGLAIAFLYGWQMSLVTLSVYALIAGSQIALNRVIQRRDRLDVRQAEEAGKVAIESIENARTVQALTRQRYLYDKFTDAMQSTYRSQLLKAQLHAIVFGLASSLSLFVSSGAYGFGVFLITAGYMVPSQVYQVITSLNMSTMGVMNMAAFLPELLKARLAAGLIFAITRSSPTIDVDSEGGIRNRIEGDVGMKDVYFVYPTRPDRVILSGVSAEIAHGKTLAFVGPSGCGKSTVVALLNRFYDPTDGKIEIDSVDAKCFHVTSLRNQIALVAQEPTLFNCSIRENIAYGYESCTIEQIQGAARLANIHDTIMQMPQGYETRVGERGAQLSGGQKQRIAIARAVVREPRVLLLDEATSALDSESEKLVQKALDAAASGRTCVTVAHRLSTVQNADCIVVLRRGRVVEFGNHRDLIAQEGVYHSMVMKQKLL